jgi:predicted metal-binding membrane protein
VTDSPSLAAGRPALVRFTPQAAALFLVASVAWVATIGQAARMGNGPGTMGLGIVGFLGVWALMMGAMMLPSVAPVASLYARTVRTARLRRLGVFTAGYLAVWVAAGIPVYALLRGTGSLAGHHDTAARITAAVLLATAGVWQLSGAKDRCLAHCRSPFSLLLHYGSYRGRLRDLRTAVHHAGYCLGCCWALMVLLAVFGVMNLAAMAVLAIVVLIEKIWRHGTGFSRLVGLACLSLALVALFRPGLTPGLHQPPLMHMGS